MAGSFAHVTDKKTGKFLGTRLLDTLGDCGEALEEMHVMLYILAGGDRGKLTAANNKYYAWVRGEIDIPEWPGILDDSEPLT